MGKKRVIVGMVLGLLIISGLVFGIMFAMRNTGKTDRTISTETAQEQLAHLVREVSPYTAEPRKSAVEYTEDESAADELPDMDPEDLAVRATTDAYAEIWSSSHKTGQGSDGWLREMAEQFNASGAQLDGKPVSIQLRGMSSGLAIDYIVTGKEAPAGYSPSSMLFVKLLEGRGVGVEVIRERTVGNVAGILLKKDVHQELVNEYGTVDLKAITEAVGKGELTMGYTNPFTSSTGLNFLMSTLLRFDQNNPLSDTATERFREFQTNVPFVAMTTIQMRTAAERGTLDGFMLEWQSFQNEPALAKSYVFTPFGYRHDNPLVACPTATSEERRIMELFAQYCDDHGKELADEYGFNGRDDYQSELPDIDGKTLVSAQELYKKNKDAGRAVIAVFVADVSGSMSGAPLNELKTSLINGMRYINTENHVGLVSYADDVTIELPIGEFDLNQQSLFKGAVESMGAGGGTATFDGIIVAASMIEEALEDNPQAKPLIFVLSDGETNQGVVDFQSMKAVIDGLNIPVYTIGYNANIEALKQISDINEAANINASTDDVTYQLRNLFNANM